MRVERINGISIDEWKESDGDYIPLDFSKMNAIDTCAFKGILKYVHNKVFSVNDRNLALECGSLCHCCFAAYRAFHIYCRNVGKAEQIGKRELARCVQEVQPTMEEAEVYSTVEELIKKTEEFSTPLAKYTSISDWLIDHSAYYDDPEDKKRTIANIKESLTQYCSNLLQIMIDEPVWIEDINNENSKVGIEIPFETKVTINYNENCSKTFKFIGKLDGIHVRADGTLIVHENKTASRLDDSWVGQWYKSHQITGYCLAASYFTTSSCMQARVLGMQIPVPKYSGYAFRTERVDREEFYFTDWARWCIHVLEMIEDYQDIPEKAPMNTHACCKYYKQCEFTPLCVLNEEERLRVMNEEMIVSEWNPLDD